MNAIEIIDVHKKFKIHHDKRGTLKEKIIFWKSKKKIEERWVLKGINLNIQKGETVGFIGCNGSGKSTLLKLVTKIIYPNGGMINVNGRVSSLLELGAGFHPDMTGRENIYTNASIFGLGRKEIDEKLHTIITFSELEEFIDNPVRTYSSGMYMRLAFSVAINVEADILLIDEILAVGDANFQSKCFNKLRELKKKGTTIVIVSHDMGSLEKICDKLAWIQDGILVECGNPVETVMAYMNYMGENRVMDSENTSENINGLAIASELAAVVSDEEGERITENQSTNERRWGNKAIEITSVLLTNGKGVQSKNVKNGEAMEVSIAYIRHKNTVDKAIIGIGIFRNDGVHCYGTNTEIDRYGEIEIKDKGEIVCNFESLNLLEGQYKLDIAFHDRDGFPFDYFRDAIEFSVYDDSKDVGVCRLFHEWHINSL